ncbi:MAG: hypothetical protein HY303_08540 [Candidatus Wallbacteria bacterium]|nr:hypothetical protein [Candidatus Wallbacteria bacterium]
MISRTIAGIGLAALAALCLTTTGVLADSAPAGLRNGDVHALIANFRAADTDHNGILSHSELAAHFHWTIPAEHAQTKEDKAHGFSKWALIRMLKDFPVIDADRDGVLSHQELISFYHPKEHAGCDHAKCEKARKGQCCGKCAKGSACPRGDRCGKAGHCGKGGCCGHHRHHHHHHRHHCCK